MTMPQRWIGPSLWLLLAGLLGWLLWLLDGGGAAIDWGRPPAPVALAPLTVAGLPAPPARQQFAEIWQRPLLSPDRRPAQRGRSAGAPSDYRLTGVILTAGLQLALLQRLDGTAAAPAAAASAPPGIRVRVGQHTPDGQWQLLKLEPRQAWFEAGGRRFSLELHTTAIDETDARASDVNRNKDASR